MENYTVEHIIKTMGGAQMLSSNLGINITNFSHWLKSGKIPHGRAWEIAEQSGGKLDLNRMPVK